MADKAPFVITIPEKCRTCYTCVRECPAKAIRITGGQAEIITERCICCGNCVRVCSQKAKQFVSSIPEVEALLADKSRLSVACLAPSFPAEFSNISHRHLVGMMKSLGFAHVTEVAFGADLVSAKYRELVANNPGRHYISTACPALVAYVERYHTDLVRHLVPVVSPMTAQAMVVRELYGPKAQVVFIGPCIAKKVEATKYPGLIHSVLTFQELHELFKRQGISSEHALECEFDPPHPAKGMLYPISGGLLQASEFSDSLLENNFLSAEGTDDFVEILREFENGVLEPVLLDLLCCKGCIMGSGMATTNLRHNRRSQVSRYSRNRLERLDFDIWLADMKRFSSLNLSREFRPANITTRLPSKEELQQTLATMGKNTPEDELNCGACGYRTCVEHAVAIYNGLAESEMCLPYTIEKLKSISVELIRSDTQMKEARNALVQSEKLASMGQLAAGIVHEVNNPIGVVLLYAHLLLDELPKDSPFAKDLQMIAEQADRCKKIVGGLLNFARTNKVFLKNTDIPVMLEGSMKSVIKPDNITIELGGPKTLMVEVDPDQLTQVVVNMVDNAMEAMPSGGKITVSCAEEGEDFTITVEDTGSGIQPDHLKRIFQPFFTTKQIGQGTGLGLAVAYGIIKLHRGSVIVKSNNDPAKGPTGTQFVIKIPKFGMQDSDFKIRQEGLSS